MTDSLELLRELIALPSVNPAFLPAGHAEAGELRVAQFLADRASKAGLHVELPEALPGRPNLLATLKPTGKAKRRLILAPHMDTVGVVDQLQFTPCLRDGRLYGRGACDTKGPASSMFTALLRLAEQKNRPHDTEIVFAGLIDEENGQSGSRALAASGLKADLAIVGEPTCLRVITAHKGTVWLRFETLGKAAHGARPELGRNAVHEMARIVDLIETTYAARLRQRQHPLLGHPTINVGMMSGGTQPNIVPATCQALADRRTIPGETDASVKEEILALLREHGLNASLTNLQAISCLPMETDPSLPLACQFLRSMGQTAPAGVDYFCDASVLSEAGIPSVVFGPGDIAQAHTSDEWISVDSLQQGTDMLFRFLQNV